MANAFDRFDVQGGESPAQPVGNPFDAFDGQSDKPLGLGAPSTPYKPPESLVGPEIKGQIVSALDERRSKLRAPDASSLEDEQKTIEREANSLRGMRGNISSEADAKLFNDRVSAFNEKLAGFRQRAESFERQAGDYNSNLKDIQQRYEDLRGPEKKKESAPGLFSNSLRNAGERGFDLLGNAVQFVGNIVEKGNEKFQEVTGLEVRRPKIPFLPDDYASSRRAIDAGQEIEDQSLGYKPNFTIDKALDEPTLRNLAGAVAEQGPAALADMAALILSTPAYLASRTQEIGEARVENDGGDIRNASPELQKAIVDNFANGTEIPEELQREADQLAENGGMPELKDYLVAGPTAAASVLLDRFALGKLLPGGGKAIGSAKQVPGAVGRASVTEAGTEAIQEGAIEYAGESVGTEAGWNPNQAVRRAAGGALVGGPTGGVVRGGTATYEVAAAKRRQAQGQTEPVGEGARMDAEPGQEGADVTPTQTYGRNPFDQFDQPAEASVNASAPEQQAEPPIVGVLPEQQATDDDGTLQEDPAATAPAGQAEVTPEQDAAEVERQEIIRRAREQMDQTLQAGDAQFDTPAALDSRSQPEAPVDQIQADPEQYTAGADQSGQPQGARDEVTPALAAEEMGISSGVGGTYLGDRVLNMDGEFVPWQQIVQGGGPSTATEQKPLKPETEAERARLIDLVTQIENARRNGKTDLVDQLEERLRDIAFDEQRKGMGLPPKFPISDDTPALELEPQTEAQLAEQSRTRKADAALDLQPQADAGQADQESRPPSTPESPAAPDPQAKQEPPADAAPSQESEAGAVQVDQDAAEPAYSRVGEQDADYSSIQGVRANWSRAGIQHAVSERGGVITVDKIVVPEAMRNDGRGTEAMKLLLDYADRTGQTVALSPSSDFGGQKPRLKRFYRRMGFVDNKGANRDFEISESMYRSPDPARYRRAAGQRAESLTAAGARTVIDGLMNDWKGAPKVTVADSISEFPKPLREAIRQAGAESDMRAVFWNDQVYVLAPRISNEQALQEVILHEVVGHYGLRKMLGDDLKPLLNQVYMRFASTDRAKQIIRDYYPDGNFDANNREHRLTVGEELLAHMAESGNHKKLWNRVVSAIREGLRKLGFTLELSEADLLSLLRGAQRTVEQSGISQPSESDVSFSRAGRSGSDRAAWPADFPKVPFAAELGAAEKHPRYAEAKAGDVEAARELVDDIVDDAAIDRVREMIGDRKPLIVSVFAEESTGRNMIPVAYATRIAKSLELDVDQDIIQSVRAKRTGEGADYRLANHAVFEGGVESGRNYLIVDDTMTMGGTLAGLRGHIEANGGNVIGATTLTGFGSEGQLALTEKMRQDLLRKHGEPLNDYLQEEFGYGIDSLTQGEAGHFRKASSLDSIRERIDAARSEDGSSSTDGVIPPGFRFSRAGIPDLDPQPFGPPSDTLIRRLVSKIADKHTVLKGVQKNIQEQFGEISDPANAYRAEELFHGKVENDVRLIQENMVEPLAKAMSENNVSLKQLDEFLYALHAPERNAVIAERNPEMPEGGSGMTDAEAAAIIAKVDKEGKLEQYQALAKRVHDMLAMRRKILKSAGLLDEDTVGAWEASYKNYVPLKGWATDEQQSDTPRIGKGFAISGKESQMAAGRKSKAASPLANTISDLSEAVLRRRKNEVGQSFMNLVEAYPNDNYWRIYTDENPEVERKAVRVKDPATGKMKVEVREQTIPMAMMSDRYFTTKVDGKTHYIKIEDQRLMNAMRNIGPDNSNLLIRSLASVTRVMSSLYTGYSPEFVISNFSRDIQTALLNLTSEQSSEDGKVRGKKIAVKTLEDVGTSIRAINASLKGKKLTGKAGEWQAHFDRFRADGAKTGWFDMKDIDGQMKDLEKMIAVAGGGATNTLRRAFKITTDWVENTNSAIENGVRLSAYVNAIEAGIPRSQAASLAKNMTVNFNRKGELGTIMNALYMFANASVQGTANFVRTLGRLNGVKGDPMWRRMHTAQKIAVGMAAGGFALSMLNRMVAGEDDDEVNWWDKVPDYVKERNIVIMKSLVGGEPGKYWTIPLPYGYNIFPVVGTSMEQIAFSDKSAGDISGNVILAALGSFSPIGFEESKEAYGVIAKNIMPTILRPVASISLNENFMGGPIFKENFPFGTQKPDSALYFRSTPEAFKELAAGLNEVTGGSEFRSGAVDLSPDVMQFLVGYYGGGAYDFFTSRTPNFLTKLATGVELDDREIPFKRKLTGKVLPYEDQSIFYDRRNEIQQLVSERKNLKGRERIEFSKDYRKKLRLQSVMKSAEDRLKMLRKQRDRIEVMGLSAAEEDEKLQRVEKQMKRAIDQFNKRYNAAED